MGQADVGNIQTGLNADTSYIAQNGTFLVPPGGVLPTGMPFTRNLLNGQGNYLSKFASLSGFGQFASGDALVPLQQSGAVLATTGASGLNGVFAGTQPFQNPWLNGSAGTVNTSSSFVEGYFARTGLRLALVCVPQGGTTMKVGDYVSRGPTVGTTSINPFYVSIGGTTYTAGQTIGQVAATPIYSQVVSAVGPGATLSVGVNNTNGMTTALPLTFNPGGSNQETVTPSAVTAAGPGLSTLTIVGVQGSAATVQITFNLNGYQGSTGVAPTGTATTPFTVSVNIPATTSLANTTNLILAALQATGFVFGAPQSLLGIGAGSFAQNGASAGAPATGPLIYATSSAAGTINFSAANPGAWANTLLTYTVTVLNGTTQTFNGAAAGSATPVAFTGGVNGLVTCTLQNNHQPGEPVIGLANTAQTILIPAPATAGMINVGLVYLDLIAA